MNDPQALKQSAITLTQDAQTALGEYLDLHERLFSWKNRFGWNKVDDLKPAIPVLLEKLTELTAAAKDGLAQAQSFEETIPNRVILVEFYGLLSKYLDFLRQAVQVMERLCGHIEAKSLKKESYKPAAYEGDLAIYKQKVDNYQLYGVELNALISRLTSYS